MSIINNQLSNPVSSSFQGLFERPVGLISAGIVMVEEGALMPDLGIAYPQGKALLEAEAEKNQHLLSQIEKAVIAKNPDEVRGILSKLSKDVAKALVNTPIARGATPLLLCKDIRCMELLLDAGANPLHVNDMGQNFVMFMIHARLPDVLNVFLKRISKDTAKTLVNTRDNGGKTVLHYWSTSGWNPECMHLLLNAGANPDEFSRDRFSAYEIALNGGLLELASTLLQREPSPSLGYFSLRLLGHAFGYEPIIDGDRIPGSLSIVMQKQIAQDLQRPSVREMFSSICTDANYEELTIAFDNSSINQNFQEQFEKTAETIRSGRLVILPTGWIEHGIALVFREGYLVICNRGEGCYESDGRRRTFFIRKIDLDKVTPTVIKAIFEQKRLSSKEGIRYFYDELPKILGGVTNSFCQELLDIAPKPIKVGVCSYAAGKAALRASLALLTHDCQKAKEGSKAWATQHREWALDFFRKTPSSFSKAYCEETIAEQAQRLKNRKEKQLQRFLTYLQERIRNKQPIKPILDDLEKFYGKEVRKQLQQKLRRVSKGKRKPSDPQGRFRKPTSKITLEISPKSYKKRRTH